MAQTLSPPCPRDYWGRHRPSFTHSSAPPPKTIHSTLHELAIITANDLSSILARQISSIGSRTSMLQAGTANLLSPPSIQSQFLLLASGLITPPSIPTSLTYHDPAPFHRTTGASKKQMLFAQSAHFSLDPIQDDRLILDIDRRCLETRSVRFKVTLTVLAHEFLTTNCCHSAASAAQPTLSWI